MFLIFTIVVGLLYWLYSPHLSSYELSNLLTSFFENVISWANPSWQQTVLVFTLVFLHFFRKEIADLINRIKTLNHKGVECYPPTQQQPVKDDLPEQKIIMKDATQDSDQYTCSTIERHMRDIEKNLIGAPPINFEEKIEKLKYYLADLFYILRCERVYAQIYGGQIKILKNLEKDERVSEVISELLEKNKKEYSNIFGSWDVNAYMSFLIKSNLIMIKDEKYIITDFGRDFLKWMSRFGMTENKIY